MFGMNSSLWRYTVYTDIPGEGSNFFNENFHITYSFYIYLSPYVVWLFIRSTKSSYFMMRVIPDDKRRAVP